MTNYKLQYNDFLMLLEKEINLLASLCLQYDKGDYDYANVISTKITSIINFKGKQESILPNMNKQNTMSFCATSKVLDSYENVLFYRSLVVQVIKDNKIIYSPKFNQGKYPLTWVPFATWVNSPVYIINLDPENSKVDGLIYIYELNESTQKIITRSDILKFYRDKFVGAHSDLKLDELMFKMATHLSSIEHLDHPNARYQSGEKYVPGEPIKYMLEMAVRQIAHELILSVKREFDFQIKYKPTLQDYFGTKPKNTTDVIVKLLEENEDGSKQMEMKEL